MSDQRAEDAAVTSTSHNSTLMSSMANTSNSNGNSSPPPSYSVDSTPNPVERSPDGNNGSEEVAGAAVDANPQADGDDADRAEGSVNGSSQHLEDSGLDKNATGHDEEEEDAAEIDTVAANDVKNIIIQVLSPYFDDDVRGGTDVAGIDTLGVGGNSRATPSGTSNPANKEGNDMAVPAFSSSAPQEQEEEAGEDVAQRYDHIKSEMWIARICDGIMERLLGLGKPFKFVVHTMVMRKCGAGLHVCSSCYYAPSDGWLSHSHELSVHLYAVVTVYWCAM
ncbi:putative Dynein-light chain-protein [Leptomonas seymouri]|uniref:Putative Dynein-light chain-protein n=1 Tax=Leptomonas seymouri TaxID=5684 RepID=A0A0N0P343_LEPSE|nr:putative Dynein-light chain-protein [Leptomonas seymouri]|eukprot:KPI83227.1 putative Dynein-light chain-protein [Leptomonas seymouri]